MPRRRRRSSALLTLIALLALPALARAVEIEYHGHSCFVLTSAEGKRLLIDPFATNEWPGLSFPVVHADYVLVTHPHWDHDAWRSVRGKAKLEERERFKEGGFVARALPGRHAKIGGESIGWRNTVYAIEVDGLRICHLGDNGPPSASPDLAAAIGPVDILMLPVDSEQRVLTYDEARQWIEALAPRVVIPMHYRIPGLALENVEGIGTIDEWLSRLPEGVPWVPRPIQAIVERSDLPASLAVWVFTLKGQEPIQVVAGVVKAAEERDKAALALTRGDHATALESLLAVALADPADAETRQKIGFLYLNDRRPDRALEFFGQGVAAAGAGNPRVKSLCWLGSGMALDALGRRAEAVSAYKEVIALGVNDDQQVDNARRWIERPYEAD